MGSYCHDAHRLYVRHVNSSMDGLTMNKHKHADLIIEWAKGATIQMYVSSDTGYIDCPNPQWLEGVKYRVKPIEKWTPEYTLVASEYLGDNPSHSDYNDISADVRRYWKLIKFVEEFDLDEDNQHYEVFGDADGNYDIVASHDNYPSLGAVRMSKRCAEKLRKMLNKGEIEL